MSPKEVPDKAKSIKAQGTVASKLEGNQELLTHLGFKTLRILFSELFEQSGGVDFV